MPSTNGHDSKKKVILYARVSTDEQVRSGYSLAQQLEALRKYAAREGYEVLEEVTDPGQSGASLARPGLDRVRDLVAAGVFLFFFYYGPTGNVGVLPLVVVSQTVVAAWVVWSVLKLGSRPLLRILLLAGGVSFLGLFGWYFLLAGEGAELVAIGDLLYLVAGLLVVLALLLSAVSARLGDDSP
jgi:hypothetical protein